MIINYDDITWIDVNSNFGEDADAEVVIDVAAINNSLFNVLSCEIGSRPFLRDYGCQLLSALFEPVDGETQNFIDILIFQAISRWEPRIKLDRQKSVVAKRADGTGFDISLSYVIIRTQLTGTYAFNARRI
jgi:phage baseplate assembly protein W